MCGYTNDDPKFKVDSKLFVFYLNKYDFVMRDKVNVLRNDQVVKLRMCKPSSSMEEQGEIFLIVSLEVALRFFIFFC